MREFLAKIPFHMALMVSLLLGLAPFFPEPHIWEKLKMLADGTLSKPIDIFDLLMHGAPWVVLMMKIAYGQFGMDDSKS